MEQTGQCSAFTETHPITARRSWQPAAAIRASFAFHLSGLAALALDPASWTYVGAGLAGNHAILGLAGMLPRSRLLGPNLRQLPRESVARREIALTFDDGPDPSVTPRVLDILDRFEAKATFFCVGAKAAAAPEIVREIIRRGHAVENHTQTHPTAFAAYGVARLRREIEQAQETISALCGSPPTYFRAPAGLRNPLLDLVPARLELTYVSWTRRAFDTIDENPSSVLNRLVHNLGAGDVLALHDGGAVRSRQSAPPVVSVLPRLLQRILAHELKPVTLAAACRG